MIGLLSAIERMHALASAGFPKPPTTQPVIQRSLQVFDEGVGLAEPAEELLPLLRRANDDGVQSLSRRDVNRVLRGAWFDPKFDDIGAGAIRRAEHELRRSSDQAVIEGYLVHFPADRPIIAPLAEAASRAAYRHEWAWQRRAEKWRLFDPNEGPSRVARGFVASSEDLIAFAQDTGLGSRLAATNYGRRTFAAACDQVAEFAGSQAEQGQRRLLSLFDTSEQSSDVHELARALLQPWVASKPDTEHRKMISAFLVDQLGDPRVDRQQRWKHIVDALAPKLGAERARSIVQVLKRWLTEVAMREFFKAIAKTTDRPDQWRQRSAFWLAYLDNDLVEDAWPALGVRAKGEINDIIRATGERSEYGIIQAGPPSSSSLIMKIGDLRIAEWSDNGSCRFWSENDARAPKPYLKTYDGRALRTTAGRSDFEYLAHSPSPGWESKFAGVIHRRTGIAHPILGKGRGRNWNDRW